MKNFCRPLILILPFALAALLPAAARAQDADGDGMPDSYEFIHTCLQGNTADGSIDFDQDGLSNFSEFSYSSILDPCNPDSDFDVAMDGYEVYNGSNAINYLIHPNISIIHGPTLITKYTDMCYNSYVDLMHLSWNGNFFLLNWSGIDSQSYISILSDGSTDSQIADIDGDMPEVQWNKTDFSVFQQNYHWPGDYYTNVFRRFSKSGDLLFAGDETPVGSCYKIIRSFISTSVGYNYLCIDWTSYPYQLPLKLMTLDQYGNISGSTTIDYLPNYFENILSPLIWTGSEYITTLYANEMIKIILSSSAGGLLSESYFHGYFSKTIWTGSEIGLFTNNSMHHAQEIIFQRISKSGIAMGDSVYFYTGISQNSLIPSNDYDVSSDAFSFIISYVNDDIDGDTLGTSITFSPPLPNIISPNISNESQQNIAAIAFLENHYNSKIAWTGSELGMATLEINDWNDCGRYFTILGIDRDGDGLDVSLENISGTNQVDWDSDDDGISDGDEVLILGTNPLVSDTDDDGLPDQFEVDNSKGQETGKNLDPLIAEDGTADFDGDGIENSNEYWNGTSLWAANPAGYAACGYWGEADNDGFITGNDRDMLLSASIGNPTDYSGVYPPTGETQDLDGDEWFTGNDVDLLNSMMVGADTSFVQSRPAALEAIDTCAATLAVGDTCHVSVAVLNSMTPTAGRQAGVAVVFTVDPSSTGSATILGGEGAGDLGAGRYDLSTSALSSPAGVSRAVVRADSAGTVKITARVPQCGTEMGVGRSSAEIVLPTFATVTIP